MVQVLRNSWPIQQIWQIWRKTSVEWLMWLMWFCAACFRADKIIGVASLWKKGQCVFKRFDTENAKCLVFSVFFVEVITLRLKTIFTKQRQPAVSMQRAASWRKKGSKGFLSKFVWKHFFKSKYSQATNCKCTITKAFQSRKSWRRADMGLRIRMR